MIPERTVKISLLLTADREVMDSLTPLSEARQCRDTPLTTTFMKPSYTIGLDCGTNSVRTVIVNTDNGSEVATAVSNYAHGSNGVILSRDPNLARQHPADYLAGAETTIKKALQLAKRSLKGFQPNQVAGIGVDTTDGTSLPVNKAGQPLAFEKRFAKNPAAMAWLWKDHTSVAEAAEITAIAGKLRPQYLAKCGGTYSSEWFWSKLLHCLRAAPEVFAAAHSWVELADYVPAALTGTEAPDKLTVGICAAGHKAMYHESWGGYPDAEFLGQFDPKLGALRARLCWRVHAVDHAVGIRPEFNPFPRHGAINCRKRLGGILRYYYREAA
jgi:L-ribulokinase